MWQEHELQGVQMVADQLGVAIAQSTLLARVQAKAQRETAVNRVVAALNSQSAMELQAALAESVAALDAAGGRLCIFATPFIFDSSKVTSLVPYSDSSTRALKVYTCGDWPRCKFRQNTRRWSNTASGTNILNPASNSFGQFPTCTKLAV